MIDRLESTFYLEVDFKKQTKAKDFIIPLDRYLLKLKISKHQISSLRRNLSLNTTRMGTCQPVVRLLNFSVLINLSIYPLFYINFPILRLKNTYTLENMMKWFKNWISGSDWSTKLHFVNFLFILFETGSLCEVLASLELAM